MLAVEWPLVRATFSDGEDDKRPTASEAIRRLETTKQRVPELRQKVGSARWNALVNAYGAESKTGPGPVASRAYYKMREMMLTCGLPTPSFSVHLCECPGGFIQFVGDRVREDEADQGAALPWQWVGLSRPEPPEPATRMLPMQRGQFLRVDVHDCDEELDAACAGRRAELVTADGAFDADHASLEQDHLPLLLAQTRAALRCLAPDGTFVVKFFEGGLPATQQWIGWLTNRFRQVALIKLNSSRPTNSERYLVARGFDGGAALCPPAALRLAPAWQAELQALIDRMADEQRKSLESVFRMAA